MLQVDLGADVTAVACRVLNNAKRENLESLDGASVSKMKRQTSVSTTFAQDREDPTNRWLCELSIRTTWMEGATRTQERTGAATLRAELAVLPLILTSMLLRSLMCLTRVIAILRGFAQRMPSIGRQGQGQPYSARNIIYKSVKIYYRVEASLKDYDHTILWLDYFNKNLKRRQGRRVNHDQGVFDPTIQELADAARAAGLQLSDESINSDARFPRRSFTRSGYVMVAKKEGLKKSQMIDAVADKLLLRRRNLQKAGKK